MEPPPGRESTGGASRSSRVRLTGIWYIVGFAFAGVSFVFLTIGAAWLISHRNRGDVHKGLPYESGIDTYGDTHGRFGLSFYIYALLFVAFDIEVDLHLPLGDRLPRPARLGGFVSMLVFVGDPAARAGLRLAQGRPDMALKPTRTGRADGRRPARSRRAATSAVDASAGDRDVVAPIVVPNTLWQSTDPTAYHGGRATRRSPTCASSRRPTPAAATTPAGPAPSRSSRRRPTTSST